MLFTYIENYKINLIGSKFKKILIRNVNTTTTTQTIETQNNKNDETTIVESKTNIQTEKVTHSVDNNVSSSQQIEDHIKERKSIYENILKKENDVKPTTAIENTPVDSISVKTNYTEKRGESTETHTTNYAEKMGESAETHTTICEDTINNIQYPSREIELPHTHEEIEQAVLPIIASSKLVGQSLTQKLKENHILLEETEEAEKRQEALYTRIKEFVDSFGIKKSVVRIGLGLAIGYTLYNIVRYRQIPFGGFLKSMILGNSSSSVPVISPNIAGPTTNINCNFPTFPTMPNIPVPNTSSIGSSIGSFIDGLGPTGLFIIGGIIWFLKKSK